MLMLFDAVKKIYDNFSLRKKFFIIAIVISVLPMMVIQIINYVSATGVMRKQVDSLLAANLMQIHSNADAALETYSGIVADIGNNETVARHVAEINVWDVQFQISKRILREELKRIIFSKEGILGAALVSRNGEYAYYDAVTLSNVESFCYDFDSVRGTAMVRDALEYPEKTVIHTEKVSHPQYGDKDVIYFSKGLQDFRNLRREPIGAILLCVDERVLSDTYRPAQQAPSDLVLITDAAGTVISASHGALLGGNIYASGEGDLSLCAERYISERGLSGKRAARVKSYSGPGSGYAAIYAQVGMAALSQVYIKGIGATVAGLLFMLLAALIINRTSNNIDIAVRHIVDSMQQANRGDLDVRIDNRGKDEFAQISQSFNHTLAEMKKLIRTEREAVFNRKEAEIKALEAQINPHFLYNTLDSINWVAIENKQFEISKMLKYLAIILRYSISNSNGVVTLEEELGYLRKYVYLQQNRFKYSFLCVIRVSDEARQCRIHKLLIQPLLENSIEHAFPGKAEQDEIEIHASLLDGHRLCITVSDNGVGMPGALVEELNRFDCGADSIKSNIGVRNVVSRIKMYYGDDGGFAIRENAAGGVCITLVIPYEE